MFCTCPRCGGSTSTEWERCAWCGAQRLLHHDGSYADHRAYGSTWRRYVAVLLDLIPFAAIVVLLWVVPQRYVLAGEPGDYAPDLWAEVVGIVVVAWFLYPCVAIGARGRTLGKRLLGLHVVCVDGTPVPYQRAAMREGVGRVLELAVIVPVGAASAASIAFDERARALHDRIAGTVCVQGPPVPRPARAGSEPTIAEPAVAPAEPVPAET